MKKWRYGVAKNKVLKIYRNYCFEDLDRHNILKIDDHPKRVNQNRMFILVAGDVWVVPFIENDDHLFLKTMYPSRKYTKLYKEGLL